MASLLVRNYSILFIFIAAAAAATFSSAATTCSSAAACSAASASIFSITCSFHVHEHQTLRNDRGHTENDDHFSHVLSRMQ